MIKTHIWGFHCFVLQSQYIEILNRFSVYFGRQDKLSKLSGQYDTVTKLASFEVVAGANIDRDSIRIMENVLETRSVLFTPFSNEDGSGDAHEALFLVANVGSLPSIVSEAIRTQISLWFIASRINSFRVDDFGNIIIISVVARADLPGLLVEQIHRMVAGWPVYYRNHITFERQTK